MRDGFLSINYQRPLLFVAEVNGQAQEESDESDDSDDICSTCIGCCCWPMPRPEAEDRPTPPAPVEEVMLAGRLMADGGGWIIIIPPD
jgi:hypothetical protein